ncbi:GMc oxidoreductase [Cotonvirus japonicus]|uniref:GMc oxidoreductase n=1 Tax=Cotonvirus japonicus TaxID=2811091 RepID=A0ABM7NU91_9VIRU|nr:GMc oxidoreductase [Cotonvirus japonicus]BCS83676.1 GMc oxidoreductase [Cotonvirus japonicus]
MNTIKNFTIFTFILIFGTVLTSAFPLCHNGAFGKGNINPDFIIVGGGTAGCVAANKCIANGHKCTVIERGIDYYTQPYASNPAATGFTFASNAVMYSMSEPLKNVFNKSVTLIEPTILGGSSSVNGMISVFTDIKEYFAELNITGWSYEQILPYYLEVTNSVNRPGYNGPVDVTNTPASDAQYVDFKNAVRQVFPNIPEKLPDMNTASINSSFAGFGPAETTVKTSYTSFGTEQVPGTGFRESAYMAYLHDIRQHPNLRIMTRSRVDRVLFGGCSQNANRVIVTQTDFFGVESQCELRVKKAVILSAGAFRTPQILLQSGVGPANDLNLLGIPVVKDLTDVGLHLDDHPTIVRSYLGFIPDSYISANLNGHAYWNYQDDPNTDLNWSIQIAGVPGINLKNILSVVLNQKSRGSIKLRSTNPADQPKYDLGHLNNPEDLVTSVMGFNKSNQIAENLGYIELPGASEVVCPTFLPNCQNNITEFYFAAYLQYASSGYHYTGTCALGKVVNPDNGLVYGFNNLYVIDASIFPKSPRGNTQVSVYAASTKLSEHIF